MALLYLPNEIILQISGILELPDYSSLLRCNRRLAGLLMPTFLNYTLRCPNTQGKLALQLAAKRGDIGTINALVDLGLPSLITEGHHISYICPTLTPTAIITLLSNKYFSVDARDTLGRTALYIAARDNPMAVRCLLSHGGDVNAATYRARKMPLMRASKSNEPDVIRILLADEETDVNGQDLYGCAPLYFATDHGCVNAMAALLEYSGINVKLSSFETACMKGHWEAVRMLLARYDMVD